MGWEIINDIVRIGLDNRDGVCATIEFGIYTDKEKKMVRGMPIGWMKNGKFVPNENDSTYTYKMISTEEGNVIIMRRTKPSA